MPESDPLPDQPYAGQPFDDTIGSNKPRRSGARMYATLLIGLGGLFMLVIVGTELRAWRAGASTAQSVVLAALALLLPLLMIGVGVLARRRM